jgi:hypothetical protein
MGTNYYLDIDVCSKCGRPSERLHIGKSSAGWRFLFQFIEDKARTPLEWQSLIHNNRIMDEYGDEMSEQEFWRMVEAKQTLQRSPDDRYIIHVGEYDFSEGEFS